LPRISGKYLPSQLRTQKAGPEPDATRGAGAGLVLAERIGEDWPGGPALRPLGAAEKELEQAFGGAAGARASPQTAAAKRRAAARKANLYATCHPTHQRASAKGSSGNQRGW
jgi:hypothetical protein